MHVGAPKTATTFLQSSLNHNRPILNKLGYDTLVPSQIRESDFYVYLHLINTKKELYITENEAIKDFKSTISEIESNKIIISEEGILHNLMPSETSQGSFGGVKEAAKAIKSVISNKTTIILTIRNQVNFIESSYKHKVKWRLYDQSLEEYLRTEVDIKKLSWKFVIDTFEELFPGKVKVIPYELIKTSQETYFDHFLKSCGIQYSKNRLSFELNEQVENEAMPDNQANFMRIINKAYKENLPIKLKQILDIISFTENIFKYEPRRKLPSFKLGESFACEIKEIYKEENVEILNKYCTKKDVLEVLKYY